MSEGSDGGQCARCRASFKATATDASLAANLERQHPNCACEQHAVGDGSPGRVADDEAVDRFLTFNEVQDGRLLFSPFFEKVYKNGLSVSRSIASDDQVSDLVNDRLADKAGQSAPKQIVALASVSVSDIRQLRSGSGRLHCVYDQTVPRSNDDLPPVPTHAGIFQRALFEGEENAKGKRKEAAKQLFDCFQKSLTLDVSSFRSGLLTRLNEVAVARFEAARQGTVTPPAGGGAIEPPAPATESNARQ